ncbi:MAG TPA: hypothetical protein VFQ96_01310 [Microbacteriaceae bacterium]|nr:hypothetical protein [Microbacteriaceae bacterium]
MTTSEAAGPQPPDGQSGRPAMPTSNPVLARILRWGGLLAAAIALAGAIAGGVLAGGPGVAGGLLGAVMAAVFVAVTAASILVANRFIGSELYGAFFFAIVLGGWIVKFVVFIVLLALLRDRPWLNGTVMFVTLVAGVVGSLVIDVVVVKTSRIGYASDTHLPDASSGT